MNCTIVFKNYNTGASSEKVPLSGCSCIFSPSLHLHTSMASHLQFGIYANGHSIVPDYQAEESDGLQVHKKATFDFKERRNKWVSPLSMLMASVHYKECAKKVLM